MHHANIVVVVKLLTGCVLYFLTMTGSGWNWCVPPIENGNSDLFSFNWKSLQNLFYNLHMIYVN